LAYSNAFSAYRETRIKTASQGQLILMLYDEAIKSLDGAFDLLERYKAGVKKDPSVIERAGKALIRGEEIVSELSASLDFEQGGDIAKNLFSLYTWFKQELLEANIKLDEQRVKSVRDQLGDLRGAWAQIARSQAEYSERPVGVSIAG
jgi:flagellar protein FliS